MSSKVLFPQVKWAQRKDSVFITVETSCRDNMSVVLEEDSLKFHTESSENVYEFSLTFPAKIDKEKSKYSADRVVHILLVKQEPERWSTLATNHTKVHWLKCDWDKWLDTDDEEAGNNKGMGGYGDMDFSNFGDMGGLDGMGENFDDGENDYESEEEDEANDDETSVSQNQEGEDVEETKAVNNKVTESTVEATA